MELSQEKPGKTRQRSNRRDSCPKPDCILTIGAQRLAAIFAEETESTLQVLIQGNPLFWVEEAGVLQMSETEVPVRVSNVVRMEEESDDDEEELAPSTPMFRVGLARLGRSEGPLRPEPPLTPAENTPPNTPSLTVPEGRRLIRAGLIALALIATPLAFMAAAWIYVHPKNLAFSTAWFTDMTHRDSTSNSKGGDSSAPNEAEAEVLRLPGVEPFLNEAVARKLELTPSQKGACQRLNDTTQAALADLEKYWESSGRLEIARRQIVLLQAARREALQLLTDEQLQQWEAMTR
jgi:hypothetical protein